MERELALEYGELIQDTEFVNNCESLVENLNDLKKVLDKLLPLKEHYDKLDIDIQIELDLFFAFTVNSLYWVYLRIQGVDPNNHPVKGELQRVKSAIDRWNQVKNRDKRVKVDIEAVKRFIRNGLYDPNVPVPQVRKRKFEDED